MVPGIPCRVCPGDYFSDHDCLGFLPCVPEKNSPATDIPWGILGFLVVWSITCILLERRYGPRRTSLVMSPEEKRKHRLYTLGILILGILNLAALILLMQNLDSGSTQDIFLSMLFFGSIAAVCLAVTILWFIFIMDIKQRNRKTMAEIPPQALPAEAALPLPSPVVLPDNPAIHEVIRGMLWYPGPTMRTMKERSLIAAFSYFLLMTGAACFLMTLLMLPITTAPSTGHLIFEVLQLVGIIALAWLYAGPIAYGLVRIQGVKTSLSKTMHSLFYASTPLGAIGWIPILGFFSLLWGLYYFYGGLVENQEVPKNYAFTAVVFTAGGMIVLAVLTIFFLAIFFPKP